MNDRIQKTIEKLKSLSLDGGSSENLSAICSALYHPEYGWTCGACERLRQILIGMLEQLDPDEWADGYLAEVGIVRLPKDSNGVPIHIGDELCGYGRPEGGVYCKATNGYIVYVGEIDEDAPEQWMEWSPDGCHHYHKPTVPEILDELEGLRDSTVELLSECMPDEMDDDDLEEMGFMRLPTDEYENPIHVDDEVECNGAVYIVESLEYFKNYGWMIGCVNKADAKETRLYAACICHHHQTVEDVLREFADRYLDYEGIGAAGRRGVGEALMSEYVTRLREVMDNDE